MTPQVPEAGMDNGRIEDLKRRIQKDPASIAFAQLGEEYRRAGRHRDAIDTCRAGLKRHPGYLSARVTLGRALLELGELEDAERELKEVLRMAPENLAALRGVADTLRRRGDGASALEHYELALALAPRDADLQQTVEALRAEQRPASAVTVSSFTPPPEPATFPPAAAPANVPAAPVSEPPAIEPPRPNPPPALPILERWLDFIVADRQHRLAHAHSAR